MEQKNLTKKRSSLTAVISNWKAYREKENGVCTAQRNSLNSLNGARWAKVEGRNGSAWLSIGG